MTGWNVQIIKLKCILFLSERMWINEWAEIITTFLQKQP